MQIDNQMAGFKKETDFKSIFRTIKEYRPDLRFRHLHPAIAEITPSFVAGLFERRPCHRRLRYLGCTWCSEMPPTNDEFFKVGEIYVATTFNGATYTIQGYGERPVGCAYFEWVVGDSGTDAQGLL